MENFKNFINTFGLIRENSQKQDPMVPKYIKPDGTKVIEQPCELGLAVYEISPDCTVICRTYDKSNKLILDYIRRRNLEIGHRFDEYGKAIYEFNSLYDENNKLAEKREIEYEYYDEGQKSKETTIVIPGEIKIEIKYDKSGKQTEKIEYKGSVKTYYNAENKPYKREIDKGTGGIITENIEDK